MTAPRKKSVRKPAPKAGPAAPQGHRPAPEVDEGDEAEGARPGSPPRPDQMDEEVVTFITAIEEYKRLNRRPFPNWSEILEVVKALGYVRAR